MKIRKLLTASVMLISLALGSFIVSDAPVSAAPATVEHNVANPMYYDAAALFYCAATRDNSDIYVDYAWPSVLAPNVVVYNCEGHSHYDIGGNQGCWGWKWQAAHYANGTLVGGNYNGPSGHICPT